MRYPIFLALACTGVTFTTTHTAFATTVVLTDNLLTTIPDGSSSGVARVLAASTGGEIISNVEVQVNISATTGGSAFLGDLYLYLTNGTTSAILANRPGRSATAPAGYGDDQPMNVTFSDAGTSDFHTYRLPLTGSAVTPLTGPLTGIWQPDGRAVDPALVVTGDPRTANLAAFNGAVADGNWSLFVADMSTGATHQLNSWTVTLTTAPIPEPGALGLGLLGLAGVLGRRRRNA